MKKDGGLNTEAVSNNEEATCLVLVNSPEEIGKQRDLGTRNGKQRTSELGR